MNKLSVFMLSLFLCASSLCGCGNNTASDDTDNERVSIVSSDGGIAHSDVSWYLPEKENEISQLLTGSGWQFLDGSLHGSQIDEADKGKIRGSSLWFRNDGSAVLTFDGSDYDCEYQVGSDGVDLHISADPFPEELAKYTSDTQQELFRIKFVKDDKYGILIVSEKDPVSVRFFQTMI